MGDACRTVIQYVDGLDIGIRSHNFLLSATVRTVAVKRFKSELIGLADDGVRAYVHLGSESITKLSCTRPSTA